MSISRPLNGHAPDVEEEIFVNNKSWFSFVLERWSHKNSMPWWRCSIYTGADFYFKKKHLSPCGGTQVPHVKPLSVHFKEVISQSREDILRTNKPVICRKTTPVAEARIHL
jgi:hypothetical protein